MSTFWEILMLETLNLSIKKNCTVFGNIDSKNSILLLHNNLNCNNFNFITNRINSSLKINNNTKCKRRS